MTKNKKILMVTLLMLILSAAGLYVYYAQTKQGGDLINYDPPSQEETMAGEKQKSIIDNTEAKRSEKINSGTNSSTKKMVDVVVTDASQYGDSVEVRAFVPSHYQDGECKIVFSNGSNRLVKKTPAKKDISTTVCLGRTIKRAEFSGGGVWQVQVLYKSRDAEGSSKMQEVIIK